MKLQLTARLLDFLIDKGYRYCFSQTTLSGSDDRVTLTLTPIYSRPKTRRLPKAYDTHFCISREPRQMTAGLAGVLVLVELELEVSVNYFKHIMSPETGDISSMKAKRLMMCIQN